MESLSEGYEDKTNEKDKLNNKNKIKEKSKKQTILSPD